MGNHYYLNRQLLEAQNEILSHDTPCFLSDEIFYEEFNDISASTDHVESEDTIFHWLGCGELREIGFVTQVT